MAATTRSKAGAAVTRKAPVRKTAASKVVTVARKSTKKPVAQKIAAKLIRQPIVSKNAYSMTASASKSVTPKKVKLVRDSFSFPAHEHALLSEMKKRALKLGKEFKKSEILRAGITNLSNLADSALVALLSKVERVKTGRPAKKSKKK